jgi:hypothetical protein
MIMLGSTSLMGVISNNYLGGLMALSILLLFAIAALITSIMEAIGKCPSFVPVIILSIGMLVLAAVPLK